MADEIAENDVKSEAEIPMDRSEWAECTIVEDIGEDDEHRDQFFRFGDYGVEACRHGMAGISPTYEAYVVIGDVPYKICDCCDSFEEAVATLIHERNSKRLEEGQWKGGEGEIEVVEMEFDGGDIAKSSITDMISKNRESRKVQIRDNESILNGMASGKLMTPRANYRTVKIGDGRNPALPDSVKVTDGADGCSSKKVNR